MRVESVLRVVQTCRDWVRSVWLRLPWNRPVTSGETAETPVVASEVPVKKKKTGRPKKSSTPTQ